MKSCVLLLAILFLQSEQGSANPINEKNEKGLIFPIRENSKTIQNQNEREGRQGGIIAGWIQGSQLFPIEINVPDILSNVTSNFQNIGQGLGQGVQNFGQNLNQNYQTWISNLGQRFPFINRLPFIGHHNSNNLNKPMKYIILVPMENNIQEFDSNQVVVKPNFSDLSDSAELFTYP